MWTKFLVMQSAAQKPDADFSLEKLEKLHADISWELSIFLGSWSLAQNFIIILLPDKQTNKKIIVHYYIISLSYHIIHYNIIFTKMSYHFCRHMNRKRWKITAVYLFTILEVPRLWKHGLYTSAFKRPLYLICLTSISCFCCLFFLVYVCGVFFFFSSAHWHCVHYQACLFFFSFIHPFCYHVSTSSHLVHVCLPQLSFFIPGNLSEWNLHRW